MRKNSTLVSLVVVMALCLLASDAYAASPTVAGFDGGSSDDFIGNASFEAAGGNPGGNAHFFITAFGISLRTGTEDSMGNPVVNPNFLGDYSSFSNFSWGLDVEVDSLTFFGSEVPRELGILVLDRDIIGPSGPAGLWFPLGDISLDLTPDWTTLSVNVEDPTQTELPPGVIGRGDEDPVTFEPILPDGATFASVLAGVDEFQVTTFKPGLFFGDTFYDVRFDNIFLVPEPSSWLLMFGGLLLLRFRRA